MALDSDFDFDAWVKLARENPEVFEEKRQQAIQQILDKTPDNIRHRMQGLQWQIDQHRQTAATPIACCIKISGMMWENLLGDDGLVRNIEQLTQADPKPIKNRHAPATILSFADNQAADEPPESD